MPTAAVPADRFIDSLGVCTHWSYPDTPYGANYPGVKARLVELGVRHVRDGGASSAVIAKMKDLRSLGIRTTFVMDPGGGVVPTEAYWSSAGSPRRLVTDFVKLVGPDVFGGMEMLNEIDLFYDRSGFGGDGYFWHPGDAQKISNDPSSPLYWAKYIVAITRDARAALHADPATAAIPLIGPSLGRTYGYPASNNPLGAGTFEDSVDLGCFHPYPGGNPFSDRAGYATVFWYIGQGGQPSANIDEFPYAFDIYSPPFGKKPMCATETGYFTGTASHSVTEEVQAKYVPRLFLEYFRKGIARTFLYELVDEWKRPADDQANRGLLRNDLSPKPAFVALKNLIALLADTGASFVPGSLDYTVTAAMPPGYSRKQYVRNFLLQKADGSFWLLLWHEIADSSFTTPAGAEIAGTTRSIVHPDVQVTVTLAAPLRLAALYSLDDPAAAIETHHGPRVLRVAVNDQVVAVELMPGQATPPAAPGDLGAAPGPGSISVTWTDLSDDEDAFEVERSADSGPWVRIASLPAGSIQFTDGDLGSAVKLSYRVRAVNDAGGSTYAGPASAFRPGAFRRGDTNADGATDISDAVAILSYLFLGIEKVPCEQAGDANDDGALDVSDSVFILSFLFLGGKPLGPPVGACGVDPTGHNLPCRSFPSCQ